MWGAIFWCVSCGGSYVPGTLPRVSYRVPGWVAKVFSSMACVFIFTPTFSDIFLLETVLNQDKAPILHLFQQGFYHRR